MVNCFVELSSGNAFAQPPPIQHHRRHCRTIVAGPQCCQAKCSISVGSCRLHSAAIARVQGRESDNEIFPRHNKLLVYSGLGLIVMIDGNDDRLIDAALEDTPKTNSVYKIHDHRLRTQLDQSTLFRLRPCSLRPTLFLIIVCEENHRKDPASPHSMLTKYVGSPCRDSGRDALSAFIAPYAGYELRRAPLDPRLPTTAMLSGLGANRGNKQSDSPILSEEVF